MVTLLSQHMLAPTVTLDAVETAALAERDVD
jgi:hypothetical protein